MSAPTRVTKYTPRASRGSNAVEACLVEISGPSVGRRYPLGEGAWVIGREPDAPAIASMPPHAPIAPPQLDEAPLVIEVDSVSRRHARILSRNGSYLVEDLQSTNGTFLNGVEVHGEALLRTGDLLQVGRVLLKFLSGTDMESQYHEAIYQLAITDGLTQIHNKRALLEFLEREMGRCHRYGRPLSLILFDIDHFKQINDTRGHIAGDHILRELAAVVRERVRREQCFARYGGEEFAVALPEVELENARVLAERIRHEVEQHAFRFEGERIAVTVSLGLAEMTAALAEPEQFVKAADEQLYAAKRGGRNRVSG